MMAISWHRLDLGTSAEAHLPPLLILAAFEARSYTIHLTDLTHIWVESLDHAAILERAEEENTSIDPSDSSQLKILLSKLGLAMSSSPRTVLNLHIDSSSALARPALTLNLKIELPGGLAPLEWPMHLAAAPQSVLTKHLTIPLLRAQQARIREMESLTDALKDKDHVIQKLMDKLEAQGTDLGQVFPQATAKGGRKVGRGRAEEKVRGLGPFDTELWRKELGGEGSQGTAQLVQNAFIEDTTLDLWTESGVCEENWWEKIKGSTIQISKDKAGSTRNKALPKLAVLNSTESTEEDDDFQVQSTPPHRSSKAPRASHGIDLDDSTDDEDLDDASQRSKVPDSFPVAQLLEPESPPKSAKGFGQIGGKKETSRKPLPVEDGSTDEEEAPVPKSAKNFGIIGGKREPLPLNKVDSTDDKEPPPPKSTKKLGAIGGKQAVEPPKLALPAPPAEDETTEDEDPPAPRNQSPFESPSNPPRLEAPKPRKGKLAEISYREQSPDSSPSLEPLEPPAQEAPKPKRGEPGHIGGTKKEATPTSPASDPSSQQDAPASQTPTKRKLSTIGGRHKSNTEQTVVVGRGQEETRGRLVKVEREKSPPQRETSGERAEKKRRELKRELEEKAKAPVKKKRKF
jgi:hypothetical protein